MKILFWRSLVCIFLLLGFIGVLLPGMPTTVFVILAAWAASKGWPQMDEWLLTHPKYGMTLSNWREHGTVPRKVKWIACSMMLFSAMVMLATNAPFWVKVFTDVILLLVAIWLCSRPEPKNMNHLENTKQSVNDAQSFASQYHRFLAQHRNTLDDSIYCLEDADLIIDLTQQQLWLPKPQKMYAISSAKNGIGEMQGSGQTPRGWHQICEKFGENAPQNAVFVARQWTGEIYDAQLAAAFPNRDWILSRILWLDGLEMGINQGAGCDSKARYIYIHGTPDSEPMGEPRSHGCIRMRNNDVIELFDLIPVNALLCIVSSA